MGGQMCGPPQRPCQTFAGKCKPLKYNRTQSGHYRANRLAVFAFTGYCGQLIIIEQISVYENELHQVLLRNTQGQSSNIYSLLEISSLGKMVLLFHWITIKCKIFRSQIFYRCPLESPVSCGWLRWNYGRKLSESLRFSQVEAENFYCGTGSNSSFNLRQPTASN